MHDHGSPKLPVFWGFKQLLTSLPCPCFTIHSRKLNNFVTEYYSQFLLHPIHSCERKILMGNFWWGILLSRLKHWKFSILCVRYLQSHNVPSGLIGERWIGFSQRDKSKRSRMHNNRTRSVFVDLNKAFDTVNRKLMWKILRCLGCPHHFIDINKSFHDDMEIC